MIFTSTNGLELCAEPCCENARVGVFYIEVTENMSYGTLASSFFRGEDRRPKKDSTYGRLSLSMKEKSDTGSCYSNQKDFARLKPVKGPGAPTKKITRWRPQ